MNDTERMLDELADSLDSKIPGIDWFLELDDAGREIATNGGVLDWSRAIYSNSKVSRELAFGMIAEHATEQEVTTLFRYLSTSGAYPDGIWTGTFVKIFSEFQHALSRVEVAVSFNTEKALEDLATALDSSVPGYDWYMQLSGMSRSIAKTGGCLSWEDKPFEQLRSADLSDELLLGIHEYLEHAGEHPDGEWEAELVQHLPKLKGIL